MQLTLHGDDSVNLIRAYSTAGIQIGDTTYRRSLLVLPDQLIPDWPVSNIAELTVDLAESLVNHDADLILLGTGSQLRFPEARFQHAFLAQGIGCEVMDTAAACRTYNVLVSEGRRALAALIF